MPKETMTPRERWLAVLNREKPDRVPMDYWATPEMTRKLLRFLGCEDVRRLAERLHIDLVRSVSPHYVGPSLPEGTDPFGCRSETVDYGTGRYGECVFHPLEKYQSVEEIERSYTWPSPDWWDYSNIAEQLRGWEDYPIRGGGSEPFLRYCRLRGQEQAYMDLVLDPELVHYCMDKLFDLAYRETSRIYEAIPGKVMITYVAEDLGSQEDLLFSPEQIREFILPGMRRMAELVKSAGAYVFTHSDGAIRKIIPDLIGIGADVLNPVQWRCRGMEREGLKRDFGEKLVFHGAMDNQHTLPFGSAEDVRREVRDNIEMLGAGGGYILAPCHNIQPNTPPENVMAMYEEGREVGWGGL